MRICRRCERNFKPSSNHLDCPICRNDDTRIPCPNCGQLKDKRSKVCFRCRKRSGISNSNWKGGKTKHTRGYVMVKYPNHPRSEGNNGYVFEHILVMENHIGRNISRDETVHHKNGIKGDNRAENLELWTGNHPGGCRISDLLKWAHEFIELHESSN